MKLFIYSVLLSLALITPALSQTNAPPATNTPTILEQAKATVQAAVSTNLNQVLIEMLSGVKNASSEIYGASKVAIHKSVDFVSEQAPEVIKQFLTWRFCIAAIWASIFTTVAGFFLFFAYKLRRYQEKASTQCDEHSNPTEHQVTVFFKWAFIVVAFGFILFGVGYNSFEMIKIRVAPKVYIIEYIINTVQNGRPQQ